MSKHNAFLLVGPAIAGVDELHQALLDRVDVLAAADLTLPMVTQADLYHAAVEIRRTHKAEGLRRKDVEGAWARVCRKAHKARGDVVIAQDAFAHAEPEQRALLLDGLAGLRMHVVLTTGDADELVQAWRQDLKKGRVHVVDRGDVDGVVSALAALALEARSEQLEKRIKRLRKERKKVRRQLDDLDAA